MQMIEIYDNSSVSSSEERYNIVVHNYMWTVSIRPTAPNGIFIYSGKVPVQRGTLGRRLEFDAVPPGVMRAALHAACVVLETMQAQQEMYRQVNEGR